MEGLALDTRSLLCARVFNDFVCTCISELHVTTHAYIPHSVWSTLLPACPGLACLELTACEGLWDGSLASLLEANPGCLANLTR